MTCPDFPGTEWVGTRSHAAGDRDGDLAGGASLFDRLDGFCGVGGRRTTTQGFTQLSDGDTLRDEEDAFLATLIDLWEAQRSTGSGEAPQSNAIWAPASVISASPGDAVAARWIPRTDSRTSAENTALKPPNSSPRLAVLRHHCGLTAM